MGHSMLLCEDKFLRLAMDLEVGGMWGTSLLMPLPLTSAFLCADWLWWENSTPQTIGGEKSPSPSKKPAKPGCFRRLLLLMLDHWTSCGEPLVEMFPCTGLFELVWIPDESLLLKTKKCFLYFFNSWLLSPVKHSFLANALLNYSILPWEDYCSLCSTWQAV